MKVSVVVAVYNPGEYLDGLVDSLVAQSLSPSELEVVFVDDGSIDGSAERLAAICDEHLNMRTVTIANSGWPGRPRNVGLELAEGEYVFFSDNDDYVFPEAMERAYALASRNGADIVFGKVVRTGRSGHPPRERTIDVADPIADDLLTSRTVHKLFRREFLLEHGIRFLEGPVRLEDHHFMAQAVPRARVMSVLADYPVYQWIHRNDGTNTSSTLTVAKTAKISPRRYWSFYSGAVRKFAETAGEGELLDAARVVAMDQAFSRISPTRWDDWGEEHRAAVFAGFRSFLEQEIPTELDERLPVLKRLRVEALRADDLDLFSAWQEQRGGYRFDIKVHQFRWQGTGLEVDVQATLAGPAADRMTASADGTGLLVALPPGVPDRADGRDRLLLDSDLGHLQLTARHRQSGVEWPLAGATGGREARTPGQPPSLRVRGTLDPSSGAMGAALEDGLWELMARVEFLGEHAASKLRAPANLAQSTIRVGDRKARAHATRTGKLAVDLRRTAVGVEAGPVQVAAVSWIEHGLRLQVIGGPKTGVTVAMRRRKGGPVVLAPVLAGWARLDVADLPQGAIADLYLRVESPAGVSDQRLHGRAAIDSQHPPYAVFADAEGRVGLRHLPPGVEPPPPAPTRTIRTIPHRVLRVDPHDVVARLPRPARRALIEARRRLKAALK